MNQKTINIVEIKIADKFEVPAEEKFDFDQEITVFLKGEIVNKQIKNNQDGSVNLILHFKALDYEVKKLK